MHISGETIFSDLDNDRFSSFHAVLEKTRIWILAVVFCQCTVSKHAAFQTDCHLLLAVVTDPIHMHE